MRHHNSFFKRTYAIHISVIALRAVSSFVRLTNVVFSLQILLVMSIAYSVAIFRASFSLEVPPILYKGSSAQLSFKTFVFQFANFICFQTGSSISAPTWSFWARLPLLKYLYLFSREHQTILFLLPLLPLLPRHILLSDQQAVLSLSPIYLKACLLKAAVAFCSFTQLQAYGIV